MTQPPTPPADTSQTPAPGQERDTGAATVAATQRRVLATVFISQALVGIAIAMGVTVSSWLAKLLLGSEALAGMPVAAFAVGSASGAWILGRATQRHGRRALAPGLTVGGVGAVLIVFAATIHNVPLTFLGMVIYGAAVASGQQLRYAATDLATPTSRGKAISVAMIASTIGALIGPNLVAPAGRLGQTFGILDLAAPFAAAAILFATAAAVITIGFRTDPYLLSCARTEPNVDNPSPAETPTTKPGATTNQTTANATTADTTSAPATNWRLVKRAAVATITAQLVMVSVMTMTPLHLQHHNHGLDTVGFVVGLHIFLMYGPSLVTGPLADKVGRNPLAIAGMAVLVAACVVAAVSGSSVALGSIALGLLGIGWNLAFVSGSALVVDAVAPDERPTIQSRVEIGATLGGTAGGVGSGFLVAAWGYPALCVMGAVISILAGAYFLAPAKTRHTVADSTPAC